MTSMREFKKAQEEEQARVARVEEKLDSVNEKLDKVLELLTPVEVVEDEVVEEVKPVKSTASRK